jgi:small subunit ribosomal protein S20
VPHSASAKKRLRQNRKNRARNRSVKTHLRTRVKRFDAAVAAGHTDEARKEAHRLQRSFDKAVSRGVIHRNLAARKKSRAAGKLNRLLKSGG